VLPANTRARVLDAGCGQTLLYWAVYTSGTNEIHGFDLSPDNIRSVIEQAQQLRRGVFDPALVEAAEHATNILSLATEPAEYLKSKALQLSTLKIADLAQRWPYRDAEFHLVQSCFALECLPDWGSFERGLTEAARVLRPGGLLTLVDVSRCDHWVCDGQRFPALYLTPDKMKQAIEKIGFAILELSELNSKDADQRDQGYGKVLFTCSVKPI
jgi:ubiquinone/menaquinone biosynthesis C-methylase UbiE